eukprot:352063-Prorocentrum_minimum.AAC.1
MLTDAGAPCLVQAEKKKGIPLGGSGAAVKVGLTIRTLNGAAGKARMASMFAKAPPAKAKPAPKGQARKVSPAPPRPLAGDAEAALRMEAEHSDSDDEE